MNDIILVSTPETNPSEQPGTPDIAVTGPVSAAAKTTGESACTNTQHAGGAKSHDGSCATSAAANTEKAKQGGSCATSANAETKGDAGSCATSGKMEAKVDVGSIAKAEIPATAGDSCCSTEKSGKPATSGAN